MPLGSLLPAPFGDQAYRWKKRVQEKLWRRPEDHVEWMATDVMVNGTRFSDVIRTGAIKGTGSNLIGFSENAVVKIEERRWETKRNGLRDESRILGHLTQLGCHCAPRLLWEGTTADGQDAFIMERVHRKGKMPEAEALLAFLELKGAGVIHGDLYPANVFWNGQHAVLIDFDQAIIDATVVQMTLAELIEYMGDTCPEHARFCQSMQRQLERWHWKRYCVNGKLDLRHATLLKSGTSTRTATGIYHSLDGMTTFVEGERGLGARRHLLRQIVFDGETILDIGCNTGLLVRYLVGRNAARVDGDEISPGSPLPR